MSGLPESGHGFMSVRPNQRSFPPPTLRECRHRGLARRLVALRRRAVLVMSEGQRPHPRRSYRCRVYLEDAADNDVIGEHIIIVIAPLAGWAARRSVFEDQRHRSSFLLLCLT